MDPGMTAGPHSQAGFTRVVDIGSGEGIRRIWITDCAAQTVAYNQLNDALNALLAL